MSADIIQGIKIAFQLQNLLIALFGVAVGTIFGALPGIGTILSVSLFIPVTYGMSPAGGLILLGAVFAGCVYGGSISAVLINTPGTGANVASAFDGYPMSQKGEAGVALGISTGAAFIGGMIGVIALIAFSPVLAKFALSFGPAEYFMLAILGLTLVARATRSLIKGLISGALGLLLAFIGLPPLSPFPRFSFGITYLNGGIPLVPLVVGLFAFSEVISLMQKGGTIAAAGEIRGSVLEGVIYPFKRIIVSLRSSIIGTVIGVIPGVGGEVATFVAYMDAQRSSKNPDRFGSGEPDGVLAPEAATTACVGGSLVPMLTLGIPGSSVAALFLGGLLVHGLQPGPDLFKTNAPITYAFFTGFIVNWFLVLVIGLLFARSFAKITVIPNEQLLSFIVVLALSGSFAVNNSFNDMILAVLMGFAGYGLRRAGYSAACLLIGFVLGPIAELSYQQSMIISKGSALTFFTRPISLALFIVALGSAIWPYLWSLVQKLRGRLTLENGKP